MTIETYDLYLIGAIESLDARIVNHDPRDYDREILAKAIEIIERLKCPTD